MESIKSYSELKIWQKGIEIVMFVYKITKNFPSDEIFGLVSQMRRSAVSIPSNIAEGWGRNSNLSFINFLKISRSSLYELETQVKISKELKYINDNEFDEFNKLSNLEAKMINSLLQSIKNKLS